MSRDNFGWASSVADGKTGTRRDHPLELVEAVAEVASQGRPVALGFECPLWIDLPDDAAELMRGRRGEGGRPWSAGAAAGALATGLVQTTWILRDLRRRLPQESAFLDWSAFQATGRGLFLWEAFVSGDAKDRVNGHEGDARVAVETFKAWLTDAQPNELAVRPRGTEVHSLIGAALVRTGWTTEAWALATPCLVVRSI